MEFQQLLRCRRMVRRYRDAPVQRERLEVILDQARRHPSAGFAQGIHFVVVTAPEQRGRIARLAGEEDYVARGFEPWLSQAPVHLFLVACPEEYRARYRESDKLGPEAELEWPVDYWLVDAGAALMLLTLAAADQGLATGFLGAHRLGAVGETLGLPRDSILVGLVTLGEALPDRGSGSLRRGRRELNEIVHWEAW